MRIALFTPYSPVIGGGSVQLRSHLEQMEGLDIRWHYLSGSPVAGDSWRWLGKPFTPAQFVSDISARSEFLPGSTARARELVKQMDADLYWVVAHYEGISIAEELLRQGKSVHLTVHDEPLAMVMRSRCYRFLYPLGARVFKRVLLGAKSVDVTSWGMRGYFNQKFDLKCFALYRSIAQLPPLKFAGDPNVFRVGHIGSLYHPNPFRRFVKACREYAEGQNRELRVMRVGISPEMDKIADENPEVFENCGELEEQNALPILANCDFLYAMYPAGYRYKGFRRLSLPIKLSTYVQAQRPIFAHTPEDSGLAKVVSEYKVGCTCASDDHAELKGKIGRILRSPVKREQFETLRNELMGARQVEQLRKALTQEKQGTEV